MWRILGEEVITFPYLLLVMISIIHSNASIKWKRLRSTDDPNQQYNLTLFYGCDSCSVIFIYKGEENDIGFESFYVGTLTSLRFFFVFQFRNLW